MAEQKTSDETGLDSHYAFGDNWSEFARGLEEGRIENAVKEMSRLIHADEIAGRSFLDVGCGSGLSSLAALRLGAGQVVAIDLDPASVATAGAVLGRFAKDRDWRLDEKSVFALAPDDMGRFDVVYSWGVLHHTGAMWRAIEACLPMVADGGIFALALYRKTPACAFWQKEKRFYSRAPRFLRAIVRGIYKLVFMANMLRGRRNPLEYIRTYGKYRGMSWHTDVEDWLGGYPYESVRPADLRAFLADRGFEEVRAFVTELPEGFWGILGSGCDEFVFRKSA